MKWISFLQPQTLVVHPLEYAGKTWQDKLADLRSYLAAQNLKGMVVSEGDEVAWLFNMRGELRGSNESRTSLYQFYPYFDSVALVESDDIRLWLRQDAPGLEGTTLNIFPFLNVSVPVKIDIFHCCRYRGRVQWRSRNSSVRQQSSGHRRVELKLGRIRPSPHLQSLPLPRRCQLRHL